MAPRKPRIRRLEGEVDIPIWKEVLFGAELLLLYASPVYYGLGVPHGDDSAVVVIPGFLGSDLHMTHLSSWLSRVGYRPYVSGIRLNAECPNLLIKYRLAETIEKALRDTRRKIHLIGHSLGGMMARSIAVQQPGDVASVITLAAPFRGKVLHRSVMQATAAVPEQIVSHLRGCRSRETSWRAMGSGVAPEGQLIGVPLSAYRIVCPLIINGAITEISFHRDDASLLQLNVPLRFINGGRLRTSARTSHDADYSDRSGQGRKSAGGAIPQRPFGRNRGRGR